MNVGPDPNRPIHPDFDGHLSKDVSAMTDGERLRHAWEGTLLLHWARQARITPAPPREEAKHKTSR